MPAFLRAFSVMSLTLSLLPVNKIILQPFSSHALNLSKTPGSIGIDSSRDNIEKAKVMFPEKDFQL